MKILLILYLYLCIILQVETSDPLSWIDYHDPYLYDCQYPDKVLHYKANVKLDLCCTCPRCNSTQTLMTIHKLGSDWNVTHTGVSDVNLTIPAPQESDSGGYACFNLNNRVQISPWKSLNVIGSVDAPKILSVISKIKDEIIVHFSPGRPHHDIRDNFTVSVEPGNVLCTNNTISWGKKRCKCVGNVKEVKDENVTIVIVKLRSVQKNETKLTLNLIKHIKPGPVSNLNIQSVKSKSAILEFCAPNLAFLVMAQMKRRNCPLIVFVQMIKTQGYYEKRQFTVIFDVDKTCVTIPLPRLTPFTRYNLSVTSGSCGRRGKSKTVSFLSRLTAPLTSPGHITYWMVEETVDTEYESHSEHKSSTLQEKLFSLNVNWKPIPHEEKGSEISYDISVSNKRKYLKKLISTKPYIVIRNVPDTSIFVEIYAKNKLGKSNSSHITIYRDSVYDDVKQLESHVEIDGIKAKTFIQEPPTDVNIEISGIYICVGSVDHLLPLVLCKEPLRKISNGTSFFDEYDTRSAVVRLVDKDCSRKSTSMYDQGVFSFYRDKKSEFPIEEQTLNITMTRMEMAMCSLPSSHDRFKFLFSVKKDGREIPRLFPFKCYYDTGLDIVNLNFKQTLTEHRISLAWKQNCDFYRPRQFLADSYHVYLTKDRECHESTDGFKEFDNKIIQPSSIEIFEKNIYACVQSFKTSNGTAHDIVRKHIVRGENDVPVWIFVVSVVFFILVMIVIVCVCRSKFRQRKAKMSNPLERTNRVFEIFEEIDHFDDIGYIDIPSKRSSYPNRQKKDSFMEDRDSGLSSSGYCAYKYLELDLKDNNLDNSKSKDTTSFPIPNSQVEIKDKIDTSSFYESSAQDKSEERSNQPMADEENLHSSNNLDSACFTQSSSEVVTGSGMVSSSSSDNSASSKTHDTEPNVEEEDKVIERLLKDMQWQSQL